MHRYADTVRRRHQRGTRLRDGGQAGVRQQAQIHTTARRFQKVKQRAVGRPGGRTRRAALGPSGQLTDVDRLQGQGQRMDSVNALEERAGTAGILHHPVTEPGGHAQDAIRQDVAEIPRRRTQVERVGHQNQTAHRLSSGCPHAAPPRRR